MSSPTPAGRRICIREQERDNIRTFRRRPPLINLETWDLKAESNDLERVLAASRTAHEDDRYSPVERARIERALRAIPRELTRRRAADDANAALIAAHRLADRELNSVMRRAFSSALYVRAVRWALTDPAPAVGSIVVVPLLLNLHASLRSSPICVVGDGKTVAVEHGTGERKFTAHISVDSDGVGMVTGDDWVIRVEAELYTSKAGYKRVLNTIIESHTDLAAELPALTRRYAGSLCECCIAERGPLLRAALELLLD